MLEFRAARPITGESNLRCWLVGLAIVLSCQACRGPSNPPLPDPPSEPLPVEANEPMVDGELTPENKSSASEAPPIRNKPTQPSLSPAGERAVAWLRSQLTESFVTTTGQTARLIDSYEDDVRAGWIYDASLAVIVFSALGDLETARELLFGLTALQKDDGSWAFSYNPDQVRPLNKKIYSGSNAWVVMAINFYEMESTRNEFAETARRSLSYLTRFRQTNTSSKAFGAISMGPAQPQSYGVESNVDCYSAFRFRAEIDQRSDYREIAQGIKKFILEAQWAESTMGDGSHFFKVGYRDNSLYLDAQTWTVLALWDDVEDRQHLLEALVTVEEKLKTTTGRLAGTQNIIGFNEASNSIISDKVWAEGSEGAVAALRTVGQKEKSAVYHSQTIRYQTDSGGIPYATENSDAWPTVPAVASTGWFILNELKPPRNPFRP